MTGYKPQSEAGAIRQAAMLRVWQKRKQLGAEKMAELESSKQIVDALVTRAKKLDAPLKPTEYNHLHLLALATLLREVDSISYKLRVLNDTMTKLLERAR